MTTIFDSRFQIHDYDKKIHFEEMVDGYEEAVVRAARLERLADEEGMEGKNPTTGVWRFTESIRGERHVFVWNLVHAGRLQ